MPKENKKVITLPAWVEHNMTSKYDSTCPFCSTEIKAGDLIFKANDNWCKNLDCTGFTKSMQELMK